MLLSKVLDGVEIIDDNFDDIEVSSVELNSQKIKTGGLFIALSGKNCDGKNFIADALQKGASAIIYEGEYQIPQSTAIFVRVGGNMRENIARIAHNFYPQQPSMISAITGTNGKTSIADFTRQIMQHLGYQSASIGTIGVVSEVADNIETLTTPDSITLHQILQNLATAGVEYVSMEASSVGIEQYRIDGLDIKVAGFTNFTQDHLDYHLTMENYFEAKKQLFSRVMPSESYAVLNADIPEFDELNAICNQRGIKVWAYGFNGKELKLINRTPHENGQNLKIEILGHMCEIELPLIGAFQAMNVLCAVGMIMAMNGGFDQRIIDFLPQLRGACGRLDKVGVLPNGAAIYVDYAHTPDALENVLRTMREHTSGRLWTVFGCGGDRDKLKRPIMGKIAEKLADCVVVTDDNPRSENPEQIRREILNECPKAIEIGDRIKAIEYAIEHLQSGDMLVLAGKGHETGQKIGDTIIPMNDIVEARKVIQKHY